MEDSNKRKRDDAKNDGKNNSKTRKLAKQVMAVQADSETVAALPPRILNVEEFVEARAFEINALEKAIQNSTENIGNLRVFQTVPRHMRRRAASYNVKRLPTRLRQRALDEVKDAKSSNADPKKKSRKARRKNATAMIEFMKRSKPERKWLETHLWHAKRMHMATLWGFKIAESSNDKGDRSTYRASQHQCVIHDASYQRCYELSGAAKDITTVLNLISDPTMMPYNDKFYLGGVRQGSNFLHKINRYPHEALGPVSFFWCPSSAGECRSLWMWIHPSFATEFEDEIKLAIADTDLNVRCDLIDGDLLRFEVIGPRSHAILSEVLTPLPDDHSAPATLWRKLKCLRTPGSLSPGVILSFTSRDPRLRSGPMQKRDSSMPESAINAVNDILVDWPEDVSASPLHHQQRRREVIDGMPTDKCINDLKSKLLVPGTEMPADMHQDRGVPVILIQRCSNPFQGIKRTVGVTVGWDIIIPSKWGILFWRSLVFCGGQAIGIRDRRQLHFEAAIPAFPHDHPETRAYVAVTEVEANQQMERWRRKPAGKRVNYERLEIKDPFNPPFADLVGHGGSNVSVLHSAAVAALLERILPSVSSFSELAPHLPEHFRSCMDQMLVRIHLVPVGKGAVRGHGTIRLAQGSDYVMAREEKRPKTFLDEFEPKSTVVQPSQPSPVIGYITSASYSLGLGQGAAIGCCTLRGLLESYANAKSEGMDEPIMLIQGTTGRVCRPAHFSILT